MPYFVQSICPAHGDDGCMEDIQTDREWIAARRPTECCVVAAAAFSLGGGKEDGRGAVRTKEAG